MILIRYLRSVHVRFIFMTEEKKIQSPPAFRCDVSLIFVDSLDRPDAHCIFYSASIGFSSDDLALWLREPRQLSS